MSKLQDNLNLILNDKNINLKPENLKDGITCLGIEGVYTGSTAGGIIISEEDYNTALDLCNSILHIEEEV